MSVKWLINAISPFQPKLEVTSSAVSETFSEHTARSPSTFARVRGWLYATPRQQSPPPPSTGEKRRYETQDGGDDSPLARRSHKAPQAGHNSSTESPAPDDAVPAEMYGKPDLRLLDQERSSRNLDAAHLAKQGWSTADIGLYRKVNTRGLEPLMLLDWKHDFRILPFSFFTNNEAQAYIKPSGRSNVARSAFRGSKALEKVFEMGSVARDDIMCKIEPHRKMANTFRHFVKWTNDDALLTGRNGVLPLIKINAASVSTPIKTLQNRMLNDLMHLDQQWRAARAEKAKAQPLPLYGVIVSHTVWAVVSFVPDGMPGLDLSTSDAYLRTIGIFNFDDGDYDVWNGLAFAIVAVHARNLLIDILETGDLPASNGTLHRQVSDEDV